MDILHFSSSRLPHLSVELDSQDVVGVAVIADLRALLEVVDVHALWHGGAHHDYQTAREQTLHDVDIWSLCSGETGSRQRGRDRDSALTRLSLTVQPKADEGKHMRNKASRPNLFSFRLGKTFFRLGDTIPYISNTKTP